MVYKSVPLAEQNPTMPSFIVNEGRRVISIKVFLSLGFDDVFHIPMAPSHWHPPTGTLTLRLPLCGKCGCVAAVREATTKLKFTALQMETCLFY